ncbi:MAG: cell division protein FtsZ [Flavobacteriaceae bacterium]|nr:cell division protein FtsZ [Flavobacteriaceae bacterium]
METFDNITFDLPKNRSNVIKVIGVGGGGSNALNYMYKQGINGVDFVVCNTDAQALENSPIPNKVQLGVSLTEGLGAGADPEVGAQSAVESLDQISDMLSVNTKMIFITAGMGGGTGTGAAPVIAKLAQELGVLTVGIVTMPFQFEGKLRNEQAQLGLNNLRKHVDSLIVINNNKLREVYGDLGFKQGFAKADEVLANASRGIAEVITNHYTQNIDLRDAKTVLANSGTAIMGSGVASGSQRANEAIVQALDSPLLNDNKILGAKNVLLLIVSGSDEVTIDEISAINEYIQKEAGNSTNIIMGIGEDDTLDNAISVTIIATGFALDMQQEIVHADPQKIIHSLGDEQKVTHDLSIGQIPLFETEAMREAPPASEAGESITPTTALLRDLDVSFEEVTAPVEAAASQPTPFTIHDVTPAVNEIEVVDAEEVVPAPEVVSPIDQPLEAADVSQENEPAVLFHLDAEEPVPQAISAKEEVTRFVLEMEEEPVPKPEMRKPTSTPKETPVTEEKPFSPVDGTIAEGLASRTAERKEKLKQFNYRFNQNTRVEDLEREPAYKRQEVELSEPDNGGAASRTSLSVDSQNEVQIRTNNSFLHDNVD